MESVPPNAVFFMCDRYTFSGWFRVRLAGHIPPPPSLPSPRFPVLVKNYFVVVECCFARGKE